MTVLGYAAPDVEAAFCTLLGATTKVPNPRPETFRRLTRAGGSQTALVLATTRLIVECWAPNRRLAYEDARQAYALLWGAAGTQVADVWVTRVELADPVNFPDTETGSARFQFIAQLTVALTPVEVP